MSDVAPTAQQRALKLRLLTAAQDVIDEYYHRFGTVTGALLGPIDSTIDELAKAMDACNADRAINQQHAALSQEQEEQAAIVVTHTIDDLDRLTKLTNDELVEECLSTDAADWLVVNVMMDRLSPGWACDACDKPEEHCARPYGICRRAAHEPPLEQRPMTLGKLILDTARGNVKQRTLTQEEVGQMRASIARYFRSPLRFVEPVHDSDRLGAHIVDAAGRVVAQLYWPCHPVQEIEAAEQATYALGRAMAEAASTSPPPAPHLREPPHCPSCECGAAQPPCEGMDTPWPLQDVLAKLIEATEHLLDAHNCDTHGHEEFRTAAEAGKKLLALRTAQPPGVLAVLEECRRWHEGDKYRAADNGSPERAAWEQHRDNITKAIGVVDRAAQPPAAAASHDAKIAARDVHDKLVEDYALCDDSVARYEVRELLEGLAAGISLEPDWKHPKLQALLASEARLKIERDMIAALIDNPRVELCGLGDYETGLTEKLRNRAEISLEALSDMYKLCEALRQVGELNWPFDKDHHAVLNMIDEKYGRQMGDLLDDDGNPAAVEEVR